MAFKMQTSKEAVEGLELVKPNIYEIRLIGFKPAFAKEKEGKARSVNLNAQLEIVNNPDYVNRRIFDVLNQNAFYIADFVHAFGLPMEQEVDDYYIPGTWDSGSNFDPEKPETWEYRGPLLGRVGKVDIAVDTYQGKQNNKIGRYFCAVENCATLFPQVRHTENLIRKSGATK